MFFRDSGMASNYTTTSRGSKSSSSKTWSLSTRPETLVDILLLLPHLVVFTFLDNLRRLEAPAALFTPNDYRVATAKSYSTTLDVSSSTILTNKSLEPACMYLSMKSRIVSQRAAKVGRDSRGDRCWRKTCAHGKQAHTISQRCCSAVGGKVVST